MKNSSNLGVTENFQKAIDRASSEIIFLCDQDDYWFGNKIAKSVQIFRDFPEVGLVYSDAIITDSKLVPTRNTIFGVHRHLGLARRRSPRELARGVGVYGCLMAFRSELRPVL